MGMHRQDAVGVPVGRYCKNCFWFSKSVDDFLTDCSESSGYFCVFQGKHGAAVSRKDNGHFYFAHIFLPPGKLFFPEFSGSWLLTFSSCLYVLFCDYTLFFRLALSIEVDYNNVNHVFLAE